MEIKELLLKFEEKEELFSFKEKINIVENEKLIKILGRENIKNSNSTLIIKSMNLPIYDVIQFKINVAETGTFLFNFEKDKIDEKIREELLAKISELKDNVEPTKQTQTKKIANLIEIVKNYSPIYATYSPFGTCELSFEEIFDATKNIEIGFPILFLKKKEKQFSNNSKLNFKKISGDYIFISIFALLFSFTTFIGVFEILNKQSIAAFLLVLAFVFMGLIFFATYSSIYKKHKEENKLLKYFLLIYIIFGVAIGLVLGFIISKFALKTDVENLNYTALYAITIPITIITSCVSIFAAKLINYILCKYIK